MPTDTQCFQVQCAEGCHALPYRRSQICQRAHLTTRCTMTAGDFFSLVGFFRIVQLGLSPPLVSLAFGVPGFRGMRPRRQSRHRMCSISQYHHWPLIPCVDRSLRTFNEPQSGHAEPLPEADGIGPFGSVVGFRVLSFGLFMPQLRSGVMPHHQFKCLLCAGMLRVTVKIIGRHGIMQT